MIKNFLDFISSSVGGMSRLFWLVCCVLPCLAIASESDDQEVEFWYCIKSISTSLEETLDCRNLDYYYIPHHIFELTAKRM